MAYTFDFLDDGRVVEWELTADSADYTVQTGYTPRFFVGSRSPDTGVDLDPLHTLYANHPDVVAVERVDRRPGFRREHEPVLAVDATHIDAIPSLAEQARQLPTIPIGDVTTFNVDISREFRYCLETDRDPTPARTPRALTLDVPIAETAGEQYGELAIDGDTVTGRPPAILDAVQTAIDERDPDVLVCSTAEIVPTLYSMADECELNWFSLSRWPDIDYQQLATRSTYASYGQIGHSPARYNVPGRVILDRSSSFFYSKSNLDGILDLVFRSRKPLQEAAWASIGNILTAIQICEAHDRGVLVPNRSWRHEQFKSMTTLHHADRGGFIFTPKVGLHEAVHELDFASLYPNIICTRNVSPDVIRCDCHADRSDVPELGYSICDEQGYLTDVLQPLIDDRQVIKAKIRKERECADPDQDKIDSLSGRSDALKWILVACFGYQGFNNAKFGRIECHEAINAFAREILLTAKDHLEAGGWRVVHGIVDSIWVKPDSDADDQQSLEEIAAAVTEAVGIELEYEGEFDWVAFVPQRHAAAGALTKYFGKHANRDEFKIRGIEARQRSTPPFIEAFQNECLDCLDRTRSPEAVIGLLNRAIGRLRRGNVDPAELVVRNRVSKPVDAYTQYTTNVAALERARNQGLSIHPGQDVRYIVVDDDKQSRDRVALAHETLDRYDAEYYVTELVRATESILSPLEWKRDRIQAELEGTEEVDLRSF
uniref:type B DNA-directed DNA polymerase n=1 Tax=Halocatena halophila TaxID=2814576 RepID=UPI002ED56179